MIREMVRGSSFFVGLAALVLAACGSSGDETVSNVPITNCNKTADCPAGTAACVDGFCVKGGCVDQDGDGAGVGPGCTVFDCDDSNAAIPGVEICGNGIDEDCSGIADQGCPCTDDTGNPLPDGSTKTCGGSGDCQGTAKCANGEWGTVCEGAKVPSPSEICGNDIDDNCDGQQDENCCTGTEKPCPGTAVCSSNGVCK